MASLSGDPTTIQSSCCAVWKASQHHTRDWLEVAFAGLDEDDAEDSVSSRYGEVSSLKESMGDSLVEEYGKNESVAETSGGEIAFMSYMVTSSLKGQATRYRLLGENMR